MISESGIIAILGLIITFIGTVLTLREKRIHEKKKWVRSKREKVYKEYLSKCNALASYSDNIYSGGRITREELIEMQNMTIALHDTLTEIIIFATQPMINATDEVLIRTTDLSHASRMYPKLSAKRLQILRDFQIESVLSFTKAMQRELQIL